MNPVLAAWNALNADEAMRTVLPCCGSHAWASALTANRPFQDALNLYAASDAVWWRLPEEAWREAFASHPRIGETSARSEATDESLRLSAVEQGTAMTANEATIRDLAEANRRYEETFGQIFIVYAAGRTAAEILKTLKARMRNDSATELREAAEQQRQITQLRLRRWLEGA